MFALNTKCWEWLLVWIMLVILEVNVREGQPGEKEQETQRA
jgi:hypothetical protein